MKALRVVRLQAQAEDGRIIVLSIGIFTLIGAIIAISVLASALYLYSSRLRALSDEVASALVTQIDEAKYYDPNVAATPAEVGELIRTDAPVERAKEALSEIDTTYLHNMSAITVQEASVTNGQARIVLRADAHLPLVGQLGGIITIEAESVMSPRLR